MIEPPRNIIPRNPFLAGDKRRRYHHRPNRPAGVKQLRMRRRTPRAE